MWRFIYFLIYLCLLSESVIFPQWKLAKGSEGIPIADIDIYYNDPDTMYAIGEKMLLSTDNGKNWFVINGPNTDIGAIKIDPFNSKIVYISHYGLDDQSNDISITTDGFQTWKRLFIGRRSLSPIIEIDPIDKKTVYVVQGPGIIHRSSDHFETWESIYPPAVDMTSLVISHSDNSTLYAGFTSKILKSTDKGKNWITLPFPIKYNSTTILAIDPYDGDIIYAGIFSYGFTPGGIYKSVDGGFTWKEINNGLSDKDKDLEAIVINPKKSEEIYIGTGSSENKIFFATFNEGNTWFESTNGLPHSAHVSSISVDLNADRKYISVISSKDSSGIFFCDSIATDINDKKLQIPENDQLYQNYPNPFNNATMIVYQVSQSSFADLRIYDILGREVRKLVGEFVKHGIYKTEFNALDLPSGIYIYRLRIGNKILTRKALLIK
ncbi:T9SS type A sorting domain-containing protein [Candidatus Dependentiae bacterium]|nr:T9SS type A sorting domain-containing protein [Candidatus Dependentiae bacterium]